jgi:hypothetical protein
MNETFEYPTPTCQDCGKENKISEEVEIGNGEIELWCYCKPCDIETNHQIPFEAEHYPMNPKTRG